MSASHCTLTLTPSTEQLNDCVFGYVPSTAPAGLFLALFFLAAQLHLYLAVSRRSLVYAFIAQCCLAEMGGYIARLVVIHGFSTAGYTAMTVLLLVTPSLLAIANYQLLAQMLSLSDSAAPDSAAPGSLVDRLRSHFSLRRHLRNLSQPRMPDGRIRPEFASSLFTALSVLTAILQGVGIGRLSDTSASQSTADSGNRLIIAGLALALFTYLCFFAIALHTRALPHFDFSAARSPNMRRLFAGVVLTQAVLSLRTLYRLIQYSLGTGTGNAISSREWCFYVFDASLVFVCVVLFAAFDQARTVERARAELSERRTKASPPVPV